MVDGSDGNVWTTGGNLLRIGMDGTAREFSDPVGTIVGQDLPYGATLTTNPNGNLYVTDAMPDGTYAIAQVTTQGTFTNFAIPGTISPLWLTSGSDGNIWMVREFPNGAAQSVARISPQGNSYTEYPLGDSLHLAFLTSGPDKNLWAIDGYIDGHIQFLVRISISDGSVTGRFPAPKHALSLVAMPDGGLWESNCHTYLTRFDTNGNAQTMPLIYRGKGATACYLAAGPTNQLYFAGHRHLFGFNVFTHELRRYSPIPLNGGSEKSTLIGPDQNFWTKVCCYNGATRLDVGILHEIVPRPSSITLAVGSSRALSVTEKRGPNQTFTAVSNNPAIATVSGSGTSFTVTGVSNGSTTVTVSDSIGNSLDVSVTVQ